MRWFRSRVRFGAYSALLALAIQFVLSFAHVHVPGAPSKSAGAFIALLGGSGVVDATPSAPANSHPKGYLGDTCSICTLIQMAGSAPHASVAQLPLALVVGRATQFLTVAVPLDAAPHILAQIRAPPIA
jgi:hypothetical protein